MATYFWTADSLATSDLPTETAAWTALYNSGAGIVDAGIVSEASPVTSRSWRLNTTGTFGVNRTFFLNETAPAVGSGDGEVLLLAKAVIGTPGATNIDRVGLYVVTRFDKVASDGYVAGPRQRADTFNPTHRLVRVDDGSNVQLTSSTQTEFGDLGWCYFRFQVNGTTLRYRWWLESEAEPTTWLFEETDATHTNDYSGFAPALGIVDNGDAQIYVAYFSVGTGVDAAPLPTEATEENLGLRITDIKEPNEADALVTGVTNARVKVWIGTNDSDWEDDISSNRVIENGTLEVPVSPEDGFSLNDTVTVEVMWTVGAERKLFITETTVVDLGSGT